MAPGDCQIPLTGLAQTSWKNHLRPGDWVLDATAGNGHDTLFLARAVAPKGTVFALDIQESALRITRNNLEAAHLLDPVVLIHGDHARMEALLPVEAQGKLALICFNLGYLPGGSRLAVTNCVSTLYALQASLEWLSPAGLLSVIAYRGHPGGEAEAEAVGDFFKQLPSPWTCLEHLKTGSEARPGPVWWLAGGGG